MLSPLYGQLSPLRVPTTDIAMLAANAYIAAVEAADGQSLESSVKSAFTDFIVGCHNDGIWTALKASCILAGARTLSGALVPLVGAEPTNVNFVSGDYNRETGLKGDGSTKYLTSNRNNNAEPQNSKHVSIYVTEKPVTTGRMYIGGTQNTSGNTFIGPSTASLSALRTAVNMSAGTANIPVHTTGFIGLERNNSTNYNSRNNATNYTTAGASSSPQNYILRVFGRHSSLDPISARLAFYSIGESLDLDALDARVSTLMSDLAAAIP